MCQPSRTTSLLLTPLFAGGLAACGSESPSGPGNADPKEFEEVLARGGTDKVVTPSESSELLAEEDEYDPADQNVWRCTTERRSVVDAPGDYATFNPNAEVLYPGSLVQGNSLAGATPEPIVVERAGGTISIDIVNGSQGVSASVDQGKRSSISQVTNDIIEANSGVVPAAFTFNSTEVQSSQHMALAMGVNYSTLTSKARTDLSFSSNSEHKRILVSSNQPFYTMSYDLPTGMAQVFAPSVKPEDFAPCVGEGKPACHISSVTFGRGYYLLIESSTVNVKVATDYDLKTCEVVGAALMQDSFEAAGSLAGWSGDGDYHDLEWSNYAPFRYQGACIRAKDEGSGGTRFFRAADR